MNIHNLDDFTAAYLEAALWSSMDNSNDQGGEPLDDNYGLDDIAPEALAQAVEDCKEFQKAHEGDFHSLLGHKEGDSTADCYRKAGHYFWLTRNHHGAGFWDGDYPEAVGKRLTEAAHAYGSVDLYVGDDGLIYA